MQLEAFVVQSSLRDWILLLFHDWFATKTFRDAGQWREKEHRVKRNLIVHTHVNYLYRTKEQKLLKKISFNYIMLKPDIEKITWSFWRIIIT